MTAPFYSQDDLKDREKHDLAIIAEARGVEVKGTGADGNVLVDDLVAAILRAQDAAGLNPAVEAEEFVQPEKRYRVEASTDVFEHLPGSEFTATIPLALESILLTSGALSIVAPKPERKLPETTAPKIGPKEKS